MRDDPRRYWPLLAARGISITTALQHTLSQLITVLSISMNYSLERAWGLHQVGVLRRSVRRWRHLLDRLRRVSFNLNISAEPTNWWSQNDANLTFSSPKMRRNNQCAVLEIPQKKTWLKYLQSLLKLSDVYKLSIKKNSHRHIQEDAHHQRPSSEKTWSDTGPDHSNLTGSCIEEWWMKITDLLQTKDTGRGGVPDALGQNLLINLASRQQSGEVKCQADGSQEAKDKAKDRGQQRWPHSGAWGSKGAQLLSLCSQTLNRELRKPNHRRSGAKQPQKGTAVGTTHQMSGKHQLPVRKTIWKSGL